MNKSIHHSFWPIISFTQAEPVKTVSFPMARIKKKARFPVRTATKAVDNFH